MAGDVKLSYINLPITFDQSLDGIAYDYGTAGLGVVLRLLCACASQQSKKPEYMLDITGERGWKLLTNRLCLDSVEECVKFITDMRSEGLCELVKCGEREYLTCPVVTAGVDNYKDKRDRAKNAANVRWNKKKDGKGGESV